MSRARDVASLLNTVATDTEVSDAIAAVPTGRKNLLYNGAMQVAQRGTSATGITTVGYLTADRYQVNMLNLGTWTQTVENDAPTGSGFRKSLKMLCTTAGAAPAAADFVRVEQLLEGQDLQSIRKGTSDAQQLTLSFWVKSNVTGTYIARMFDEDNTRNVSASYTISSSGTWEKKTITFPADTTGAFDNDNGRSLYLMWWLGVGTDRTSGTLATTWESSTGNTANQAVGQTNVAAATNNYWQITGVQLEVGDTATNFEFKSYGQELMECQRYFTCYRATSGNNEGLGIAQAASSSTAYLEYLLPENARVVPTSITVSNGSHFGASNAAFSTTNMFTTAAISSKSTRTVLVVFSGGSGLVAGDATSIRSQNADAYIFFNGMEL